MSLDKPEPSIDATAVDTFANQGTELGRPPASKPVPLEHDPGITRWAILICAGVFATTMSQPAVLRLPFQNLLKADLHVSRETMSSFFAVRTQMATGPPLK